MGDSETSGRLGSEGGESYSLPLDSSKAIVNHITSKTDAEMEKNVRFIGAGVAILQNVLMYAGVIHQKF